MLNVNFQNIKKSIKMLHINVKHMTKSFDLEVDENMLIGSFFKGENFYN